jgi:formylglycine-generating enzyme required for sulfatase activity
MKDIQAGNFKMGSAAQSVRGKPVHEVNVRAFRMGAHEVTLRILMFCHGVNTVDEFELLNDRSITYHNRCYAKF